MAGEMVPQSIVDELMLQMQQYSQQITALQATIDRLTAIIEEKNQIILNQNRARFGQSSEKRTYILNDGQLSIFEQTGDGISEKAQADTAQDDGSDKRNERWKNCALICL